LSTFTIDANNNITAHAELPAGADESLAFSTLKEFAKLTADWPLARLVEAWNSFAGVAPFQDLKPVKKFTSRKSANARIFEAVSRLANNVAEPAKPVAPGKGSSKKAPAKGKKRDTARHAKEEGTNKKAEVIAMMRRSKGATLQEIMDAAGWQAHTVRGFVSILGSKGGHKVESSKNEAGDRTYRITK
jgi:hypothetical protein